MIKSGQECRAPDAPSTGTTVIACVYKDGVVLGADGKVSIGDYIMNRSSNKIAFLSENVFILRSGSAPDTQIIADYVRHFGYQLAAESGEDPSVLTMAKLVSMVNYQNKQLVGATVVAGWDSTLGGQVYACPIGGTRVRESWAIDGSGSSYLWGYCDDMFRDDFTEAEAEAFVKEALALAMARDGSSGAGIRLITVSAAGSKHSFTPHDELPVFDGDILPPSRAQEMMIN